MCLPSDTPCLPVPAPALHPIPASSCSQDPTASQTECFGHLPGPVSSTCTRRLISSPQQPCEVTAMQDPVGGPVRNLRLREGSRESPTAGSFDTVGCVPGTELRPFKAQVRIPPCEITRCKGTCSEALNTSLWLSQHLCLTSGRLTISKRSRHSSFPRCPGALCSVLPMVLRILGAPDPLTHTVWGLLCLAPSA